MSVAHVPQTVSDVYVDALAMNSAKIFGDQSDETGRNLTVIGLLEKHGRLMYNQTVSWANKWRISYDLPPSRAYQRHGDYSFATTPRWKEANIRVQGFTIDQSIVYMDYLENGGGTSREGTINLLDDRSKALVAGGRLAYNKDFFNDGNSAAGTGRFHGLDSCLGDDGNTVAADLVANPSDSYAGLNTNLGTFGGTGLWTTDLATPPNATIGNDWPFGSGPLPYDANSPLLVNSSSTSWQDGLEIIDNADELFRFTFEAQASRIQADPEFTGANLFMICGSTFLKNAKQHYANKHIILQEFQEYRDFGLANILEFEGKGLASDWHIGANTAYVINPIAIEYFTPSAKLWDVDGPVWRFEYQKFLFLLRALGNFRLRPRHLAKIHPYA